MQVFEEMVDEKMLNFAKKEGRKFPYETNSLTWTGENQLLTTTLIQFYSEIGMRVTKIHFAVKYHRDKPFKGKVFIS